MFCCYCYLRKHAWLHGDTRPCFLSHLFSEVTWLIVSKLCDCSIVTQICKIGSYFQKDIAQKHRRNFGQLRDLTVNISGLQQDIVKGKTALQYD